MAQQGFGRRQIASPAITDLPTGRRDPAGINRSAGASVVILAAVAGLLMLVVVGGVVALNAATSTGRAAPKEAAATPQECHGLADCTNQYSVALSCGSSGEARTVSVVAADAEAAERKAERYNRDCRSGRAIFVTNVIKSAANGAIVGAGAKEPAKAGNAKRTTGNSRFRVRRR
jgi:hypothetical protein